MRVARAVGAVAVGAMLLNAAGASAQDIEALERQLEKAREAAPLVVKPFLLVTGPAKHFGDYEPRQDNSFGRGEKIVFYAEPKNLTAPRNQKGWYEPSLEVDIEVKPEKGEGQKQPRFLAMKIPSRSRIQDIFLNMTVSLGQAPPGKYKLRFTIRDVNSKKSATVEQDIIQK